MTENVNYLTQSLGKTQSTCINKITQFTSFGEARGIITDHTSAIIDISYNLMEKLEVRSSQVDGKQYQDRKFVVRKGVEKLITSLWIRYDNSKE